MVLLPPRQNKPNRLRAGGSELRSGLNNRETKPSAMLASNTLRMNTYKKGSQLLILIDLTQIASALETPHLREKGGGGEP